MGQVGIVSRSNSILIVDGDSSGEDGSYIADAIAAAVVDVDEGVALLRITLGRERASLAARRPSWMRWYARESRARTIGEAWPWSLRHS